MTETLKVYQGISYQETRSLLVQDHAIASAACLRDCTLTFTLHTAI